MPWVYRQILQWQIWTFSGNCEVETVRMYWTDLQWQDAVSVFVKGEEEFDVAAMFLLYY